MSPSIEPWFDHIERIRPQLPQWLQYIESLHPDDVKFGLDRVFSVAERLNLVQKNSLFSNGWQSFLPGKSITVTGTNGKGSTVAILESIYRNAGFKVSAFTSPHLLKFNERLKINGECVDDQTFCQAFEVIEKARQEIQLTWFEFTALAAFWILKEASCDVNILEVGAGGRLDVVNLINADVSIITNVELDHCHWFGNTREAIGKEKAGIFRAGQPAIFGAESIPKSVIEVANQVGARLMPCQIEVLNHEWSMENFLHLPLPILSLESAACAVKATTCLPLSVTSEDIKTALTETSLAGRWQKMPGPCEIILDVAHNPAAMTVISKKLEADPCKGKTVAIFGILQDKDFKQSIEILSPYIDEWVCVDLPNNRALKGQELFEKVSSLTGKQCYYYDSVAEAMHHLLPHVETQDRILVTGSFYTVAAALQSI